MSYTCCVDGEDVFDWDEGNEGHVLAHGVEAGEVEEALLDPRRIGADARNAWGERRYALIGATEEGRVLFVVYAERGARYRPITARDASDAQRVRYGRGRR